MKFCKDCVHYRARKYSLGKPICARKQEFVFRVDCVTGEIDKISSGLDSCEHQRFGECLGKEGECGSDAKFFKKASLFHRINRMLGRKRL